MHRNFQKSSASNQRAFTLIELLIVISIIGLLASIVLVSLNSARSKARDAKRLGDLHQMQTAMELYYNDNGAYPTCGGNPVCSSYNYGGTWSTLQIAPTYASTVPVDPTNQATGYGYYYARGYKKTGTNTFVSTGLATDYIMATRLENTSNSSAVPAFGGWDNGALNYLIGN